MQETVNLFPALTALAVVAVMFVLFFRETYPTEVVAIAGVLNQTGFIGEI